MTQGRIRGQQIVEHDLVVDKTESELTGFFQQMVQELKALLDGTLNAFMLDRKHDCSLDGHVQSTCKTQSEILDLFAVKHREILGDQLKAAAGETGTLRPLGSMQASYLLSNVTRVMLTL